MYRFAQRHPEKTALLLGIFPVWDVEKMTLPSLQRAWGLEGETLRRALEERNPARYPMPNIPIVICHGLNDTCVPIAQHTLKLAETVPMTLHTTQDTHSTQAFGLYDTPILAAALEKYASAT